MVKKAPLSVLSANTPDGYHDCRDQHIVRKAVEIGLRKFQHFFVRCTLVDCEVPIQCGAGSVNLIEGVRS